MTSADRVLIVHRLFDLGDRLDAVFLEIAEDSDEAGAEFGPTLLEMRPIDDVPSFVGHILLLKSGHRRPRSTDQR